MESTPAKDTATIVEKTIKDLECYKNLVDKEGVEFERIDSNIERCSTVGNKLSNRIACYRKIIIQGRVNQCRQLCCLILRNCKTPHPSATTTLNYHQPSTSRQDPPPARRL